MRFIVEYADIQGQIIQSDEIESLDLTELLMLVVGQPVPVGAVGLRIRLLETGGNVRGVL